MDLPRFGKLMLFFIPLSTKLLKPQTVACTASVSPACWYIQLLSCKRKDRIFEYGMQIQAKLGRTKMILK